MELLPIVAIVLLFWLLLIRPESKRRRKVAEMQNALQVGDAVLLTAGIFGVITRIEEETGRIAIEIAPGVEIEAARGAVAGIQDDGLPDEADEMDELESGDSDDLSPETGEGRPDTPRRDSGDS